MSQIFQSVEIFTNPGLVFKKNGFVLFLEDDLVPDDLDALFDVHGEVGDVDAGHMVDFFVSAMPSITGALLDGILCLGIYLFVNIYRHFILVILISFRFALEADYKKRQFLDILIYSLTFSTFIQIICHNDYHKTAFVSKGSTVKGCTNK